jgi:Holliday junction resolvase RusA-like endonuclease
MNALYEFLHSDRGAIARYRRRQRGVVHIQIDEVEPQSKKMLGSDRDRFQAAVAKQMQCAKRGTFTGPVALKVYFATTSRNAPQAHTIAKNILDLLGERRAGVNWPRRHLVYKDDAQIQALSVSCRHGENRPTIEIEARPLAAMLDDLELAANAIHADEMSTSHARHLAEREDWKECLDNFRDLIQNEAQARQRLGDKWHKAYFKFARWNAQQALLGQAGVDIPLLNLMYGTRKAFPQEQWARLLMQAMGRSKLRLQVGELPIAAGGSAVFKQKVENEIAAFKQRWAWVIDPLVVAVCLEVVVRPNPATPAAVLHDLDNIVRDYLLPRIVPSFGTVSDYRWTINFEELRRIGSDLAGYWRAMPPLGTKRGVTRYEVWRLPPVADEAGFVSVALVADMEARGDLIEQIDRCNRDWAEQTRVASRHW